MEGGEKNHTILIRLRLQSLENVIRADTEATIGDLELLNRINLHAKNRYQAMANAAEGLGTDSEYLSQKCLFTLSLISWARLTGGWGVRCRYRQV